MATFEKTLVMQCSAVRQGFECLSYEYKMWDGAGIGN